tara:strand:- start:317 stop:781 length:465 start_codon:yes stop_codon:yes gene_type:complete
MNEILTRFNKLLEYEREQTLKNQFERFVHCSLPTHEKVDETLYEQFRWVIDVIDKEDIPVKDKMVEIMNSEFIDYVISFKSNAREKELQKLTLDLSDFFYNIGHGKRTPQQIKFSHNLRMSAQNIDPRKDKRPKESMNSAWKRELSADIMRRFK